MALGSKELGPLQKIVNNALKEKDFLEYLTQISAVRKDPEEVLEAFRIILPNIPLTERESETVKAHELGELTTGSNVAEQVWGLDSDLHITSVTMNRAMGKINSYRASHEFPRITFFSQNSSFLRGIGCSTNLRPENIGVLSTLPWRAGQDPVTVGDIADIWYRNGESEEVDIKHNLHSYISRLKAALRPLGLVVSGKIGLEHSAYYSLSRVFNGKN